MKFMLRVEITDRTETHAVLGSTLDPREVEGADAVLAGGIVWVDPWGSGIAPGNTPTRPLGKMSTRRPPTAAT